MNKNQKIWLGVLAGALVLTLILVLVQSPKSKDKNNISEATAIQMSKTIADLYETESEIYVAKADQMVSQLLAAGWIYNGYGQVSQKS